MIKKVRDLRLRLEALAGTDASSDEEILGKFLQSLADLDDMNIESLLRRLRGETKRADRPVVTAANPQEIISRLKSALPNDDAFHGAMSNLAAQKSATKPILTQVFHELFDRTQGVPKKATRAELLRLIEDERNIIVRNQKMGQMLGRRAVPAE
ncbi:MAG: hypothetical protein ABL864_15400 [Terricaulis sp.]